jgi:hypothetical protein
MILQTNGEKFEILNHMMLFVTNIDRFIGFQGKRKFLNRKEAKIDENIDHNNDPGIISEAKLLQKYF